jgi:hypothetical protein
LFEQPRDDRHLPSWLFKLFVISTCVLGIGCGLCGLDAHLYPHAQVGGSSLAFFGFVVILIAAPLLAVVVLIVLVSLVTRIFPR